MSAILFAVQLLGALPAGDDLDTQLLTPLVLKSAYLSHPGAAFADDPFVVAVAFQLERAPVVLERQSGRELDLVPLRASVWLSAQGAYERLAWTASVPFYVNADSDERVSVPRASLGDASGSVAIRGVQFDPFALAVTAQLWFPTATARALVGEGGLRFAPGAAAELAYENVSLMLATSILLRSETDTELGLDVGAELHTTLGVGIGPSKAPWRGFLELRTRRAIAGAGRGLNPADAVLGARFTPEDGPFSWTFALGMPLNIGYGAAAARALVTMSFAPGEFDTEPLRFDPPEDHLVERTVERVVEERITTATVAAPPPTPHRPEPLCRQVGPTVRFAVGKETLTRAAQDELQNVAAALEDELTIAHVIIDGHASQEGRGDANWRLSIARATAVMRALVEAGVSQERLSIRGFGEVVPVRNEPDIRPEDRRVTLCVVRVLDGFDDSPNYRQLHPWTEVSVQP